MKVCNCILPTIHGSDVCNKCKNNNDSHNEYVMDMTDINKYTKMAEDCGFDIIPTKLEVKEKCEYCEVDNTFSGYGVSLISKPYISIGIAKQDIGNEYYLITNEYEELSNIYGLYSNSPFRSDKIKINYCPVCGRKL